MAFMLDPSRIDPAACIIATRLLRPALKTTPFDAHLFYGFAVGARARRPQARATAMQQRVPQALPNFRERSRSIGITTSR